MSTQKIIDNAVKRNPDIALVLEVAARARESEEREPVKELRTSTEVAANPTTAQGVICLGCVLRDERHLLP